MDLCEFKASLVYIVSSRLDSATKRDPVSKEKKRSYSGLRDSTPDLKPMKELSPERTG